MKDINTMISVMQAYADGKKIQILGLHNEGWIDWVLKDAPTWDWNHCDYRVKPEPHYRPYANADECFKDVQKHGMLVRHIDGDYHLIVTIGDKYIWLGNASVGIDRDNLLKEFVFLDGTPCGVKEE